MWQPDKETMKRLKELEDIYSRYEITVFDPHYRTTLVSDAPQEAWDAFNERARIWNAVIS